MLHASDKSCNINKVLFIFKNSFGVPEKKHFFKYSTQHTSEVSAAASQQQQQQQSELRRDVKTPTFELHWPFLSLAEKNSQRSRL